MSGGRPRITLDLAILDGKAHRAGHKAFPADYLVASTRQFRPMGLISVAPVQLHALTIQSGATSVINRRSSRS